MLVVAAGRRNGVRWQFGLALGLRQGEALGLQWADADFEQATLTVRRPLQRRTWKHGCQAYPCGGQAWRCPKRHSGGLVVDSPKSATSIRTVASPPVIVAALREHQRSQAAEQAAAGDAWQAPPRKDGLNSGTGWVFTTPTANRSERMPTGPSGNAFWPTPECVTPGCTTPATPLPHCCWWPGSIPAPSWGYWAGPIL